MATVGESITAKPPLASSIDAGLKSISADEVVRFTKYVRVVLPLDGFVFWLRADVLSAGALYNAAKFNRTKYNQAPKVITPAPYADALGSLHFSTDMRQEETTSTATNRVIFSTQEEVKDLDQIGPSVMFVAVVVGVKFSFSSHGGYYDQAKEWHYVGNAVYPEMDTQIVDSPVGFSTALVVSNSLPLWLALNGYVPFYGIGNPSIQLFPSFLVPANEPPPYAAVHVAPEGTQAMASAPLLTKNLSHSQLVQDRVRITLYGVRNDQALDFLDCVLQRSADYGEFGIMNVPTVRDDKRTQAELVTIAQKKMIDFDVSYQQSRVRDVARQLILSAVPSFDVEKLVA